MPVEKILFPTKFRELSYDSLESLMVLKEAGLKEVVLFHVISRDDVGFVPFGGYLKKEEERLREEAKIRFEDWQASLSEKGINSSIEIKVGEPVHEILSRSEKMDIDLLVIGRKKRITDKMSFISTYGEKIITRSKIPTLISKYMVQFNWEGAEMTKVNDRLFEKPMVVVGWDDVSKRTVDFLASLNGIVNDVLVFHNIDTEANDASEMEKLEKEAVTKLADFCSGLKDAGIDAEPHNGAGGILDEILRVSRERKVSMIVIGNTSGKRFLEKMLHRSISYEIARTSEVPVLLVP
jgi:nucleotide-binding universal stress UspA family protein